MKEITLMMFLKDPKKNLNDAPFIITNFGKPIYTITKLTDDEAVKLIENRKWAGQPKYHFDNNGLKMCNKHNVVYPLCGC